MATTEVRGQPVNASSGNTPAAVSEETAAVVSDDQESGVGAAPAPAPSLRAAVTPAAAERVTTRRIPHGTISGYGHFRCRCAFCTEAVTEYQRERNLRKTLPLDRERARYNAALLQARLDTWKAVYEAGQAGRVCDAIVRNRPVPLRLLAVLTVDTTIRDEEREREAA